MANMYEHAENIKTDIGGSAKVQNKVLSIVKCVTPCGREFTCSFSNNTVLGLYPDTEYKVTYRYMKDDDSSVTSEHHAKTPSNLEFRSFPNKDIKDVIQLNKVTLASNALGLISLPHKDIIEIKSIKPDTDFDLSPVIGTVMNVMQNKVFTLEYTFNAFTNDQQSKEDYIKSRKTELYQVDTTSHYWNSLEMLLRYLKSPSTPDTWKELIEYLIEGLENTIEQGYELSKRYKNNNA